ncbi:MAG TPA: hypothetical protein VIK32_01505 [Candidatus Limnocylindrales bacterium]
MAFPQFDLVTMLRCPAADSEGFHCQLRPGHDGPHKWCRCENTDGEGHRCSLPPRHPGRHHQPWYDRHATLGEIRTIRYDGTERETSRLAEKAAAIAANYGWVSRSRSFAPGFAWRWSPSARLLAGLASPHGRFTIEFEYRGRDSQPPG